MASQPVESQCGFCEKISENLLKCGRCASISYCDSKCQRQHWAIHKKNCTAKTNPQPQNSPTSPDLKQTTSSKPANSPQVSPQKSSIMDGIEKMSIKDVIEEAKKNNRRCSAFERTQQNLAFFEAAKARNLLQMKLALRVGANPDFSFPIAQTGRNVSLVHLVTQKGDLDVLQFLLEAGAQFEATDLQWNEPPLFWAVSSGKVEVIQFFIEHVTNVNVTTPSGETPLYVAAFRKDYAACELLLRKGANPLISGPSGTPEMITQDSQIKELIQSYVAKNDYIPESSPLDQIPEDLFNETIDQITSQPPKLQKTETGQSPIAKYFVIFLIVCAYIWLLSAFGSYLFTEKSGEKEL